MTIISAGLCVAEALKAADTLADEGIAASVVDMASIKPLDEEMIIERAAATGAIVTAENHSIIGGLGSAVAETLMEAGIGLPFERVGIKDRFCEGGTTPYLMNKFELDHTAIAQRCGALLQRRADRPMPGINTARSWLEAFCGGGGAGDTSTLFAENALWRDYLAFQWDLQTYEGQPALQAALAAALPKHSCRLIGEIEPLSPTEFLFAFTGPHGTCQGLLELEGAQCTRLFTSLEDMGKTDPIPANAAPKILIIGAGQSGLALGARLANQGVPYLIVEQNERVGDNWRNRYESLILHDAAWANHLPFKPFPDDWPTFTPKDMMGDWLEGYAKSLDLNVACGTRGEQRKV